MKSDPRIRSAIDESLSSVHFDARDMHAVLRAARRRDHAPAPRRRARWDWALATAMLMIVLVPLSLFALRANRTQTADIRTLAAVGQDTPAVSSASTAQADSTNPPQTAALSESDAIRIARACFEAECDTSVFTFEEYAVSVRFADDTCTVRMESVYDNGCTFEVVISLPSGAVASFSDPRLATVPSGIRHDSIEVQTWYDKLGPMRYTWPMDEQAEFSRRYEGAALRMPRAGEPEPDALLASLLPICADMLGLTQDELTLYPMLYSETASSDGQARYLVYCCHTDDPAAPLLLATLRAADGSIESIQPLSSAGEVDVEINSASLDKR